MPWAARTAGAALAALLLLLLGTVTVTVTGATLAAADPAPVPSAAPGAAADSRTRIDRLADELRKNPVYVSAARPRELPRSLTPRIAELARRTGVPTYVLAVPETKEPELLALVHDRLGENGLYVLINEYGFVNASAFGFDLPTADAARVALYDTPYGAGPLAGFEKFVDAVALGNEKAAAKAEELAARYRDMDRPTQYIGATDRQNQNLVLGIAVVLLPGLVLALGFRLSRRYDTPYTTPEPKGAGPRKTDLAKPGKADRAKPAAAKPAAAKDAAAVRARRHRGVLTGALLAAAAVVAGVVLAAPAVYPQTQDSPNLTVTQADLDARVDEVVAGLAAGPIYQDPSTPDALPAADLPALRQRIAELAPKGPVHVVVTASTSADETAHDDRLLLSLIRARTGRNGVYILVDPTLGGFELRSFGTDRDTESRFARLDPNIRYPYGSSADLRTVPRLHQVLDAVAAAEPRPGDDPVPTEITLPPLRDNRLPPLFSGDFGGGLVLGALLLGAVLLLARAAVAVVRALLRRRARAADPTAAASSAPPLRARHSSPRPTLRQLRSWAEEDVRALAAQLAAAAPDAPGRARAWDCLDAAQLLADDTGDTTSATGATGATDGADGVGRTAAVVVLAQGGLAALRGNLPLTVCRLNPLHGEATGGRVPTWFARLGIGPNSAQLCPGCRDAVRDAGAHRRDADPAVRRRVVDDRTLRLPAPNGRTGHTGHTVWDQAGPILPAAREGLDQLVLRARESASVQ
ncbi:hypothetical protein [Kitasatospora sp. CB01950]|uniref:hypothetical protein n=1 Tax=Kitasatospora sp. CB01950 TaxID=1703930 RepID=UPI0009389FFA|nr:hypothetical protein [Kitasatospora sp. CB01950]OKJ08152.1 hypothetical protein AMK19_19090 [Kitasatospora sp. CB01950]